MDLHKTIYIVHIILNCTIVKCPVLLYEMLMNGHGHYDTYTRTHTNILLIILILLLVFHFCLNTYQYNIGNKDTEQIIL